MRPSPTKKAVGTTLIVVAIGMLTNLWYALLVVGVLFFIWGQKPAFVYGTAKRLPWVGPKLSRAIAALDDLVEGAARDAADPALITRLKAHYATGDEIYQRTRVDAYQPWEDAVQKELDEHVENESFSFRHCHEHTTKTARMQLKLKKLRMIIQRLQDT